MIFPISKLVVDQVFNRISTMDGFNDTFNLLAAPYGVPATMAILFTPSNPGNSSPNFAKANVLPEDWTHTSPFRYPFLTLYSSSSVNRNDQKFYTFSGDVEIGLNVFLDWKSGRIIVDFESLASCVEETVFTVFNRARAGHPNDQNWNIGLDTDDMDVVYNGDLSLIRSRIERAAESWRQALVFKAGFTVDQRGEP